METWTRNLFVKYHWLCPVKCIGVKTTPKLMKRPHRTQFCQSSACRCVVASFGLQNVGSKSCKEEGFWHVDMSDGGASSPVLSLCYYRRVIRGRNICHSACMVCCPISGLEALGWSQAMKVAKHMRTQVRHNLPHMAYTHVWAATVVNLPDLRLSLNTEWGKREILSHAVSLQECTHTGTHNQQGVCFINLLNFCQVTSIFPSQRNCVASLRCRKA